MADPAKASRPNFGRRLDTTLLVAATGAMIVAVALLAIVIFAQLSLYHVAMNAELARATGIDHAAVLAYGRSADYAASKYCALLLGFALIFLGSAYVLRTAKADYGLSASNKDFNASLASSSPGLVLATLGVVLVALAILTQSQINLSHGSEISPMQSFVDDNAD